MMFILNPGDGHDVVTFDSPGAAVTALVAASNPLAALYSYGAGTFRRYDRGNWFVVEKSGLQIKIIETARKANGPTPFTHGRPSLSETGGQT